MSERSKSPFSEFPQEQEVTRDMVNAMRRDPAAMSILETAQEAARHIPELSLVRDELNRCIATRRIGSISKQLNRTGVTGFLSETRLALYAGLAASNPTWQPRATLITPGIDYEYTVDPNDTTSRPDILTQLGGRKWSREVAPKLHLYHAKNALKILGVPEEEWAPFPELNEEQDMLTSPLEVTHQIGDTPAMATLTFRQGEILGQENARIRYNRSAVIMTIGRIPEPSEAI